MKQVRPVTGTDVYNFSEAMNEAYAELSRFEIERTEKVSELEALIYYDYPDELQEREPVCGPEPDYVVSFDDDGPHDQAITIRLMIGREDGRFCCECMNYNWRKGCPYVDGHLALMHKSCPMFNVKIERGC